MATREEMLNLLRTDAAFREDVRRQVLTEEVLALPAFVRELVEAQRRTEAQIQRQGDQIQRQGDQMEPEKFLHTDEEQVVPFPVDCRVAAGRACTMLDLRPTASSLRKTETALRAWYGFLFYQLMGR